MEYNNDNRTPLDRLSDNFLSELLDCECGGNTTDHDAVPCRRGRYPIGDQRKRDYYRPVSLAVADNGCSCGDEDPCGCASCSDFTPPPLHGVPLAMVYSPEQQWENVYDAETALNRGTIFKCLDFPFMRSGCDCKQSVHGKR